MPLEEPLPGSRRALGFSPSRSPASASSRLYGAAAPPHAAAATRPQRVSPAAAAAGRKPPEPLRRAVADCLSPPASHPHGSTNPSSAASEASKTLRDFIANPSTIDMAYTVLVEHALAERDRRYIPKVQTLRQIDQFCVNSIAKCESVENPRTSLWSGPSAISSNTYLSSLSASASASLVKSLNYVRSLVARHIPKLSFQPISQSGASASAKQSLPTLSSLLSRSFTSQLNPEVVSSSDSLELKEGPSSSALKISANENVDLGESNMYLFFDILKWRWRGDGENRTSIQESDDIMRLRDFHMNGFFEVGAAALLVGDMEAKMKDRPWKYSAVQDFPDIDLLQPSTATTAANFASAHGHLKAITASKRMKPGPHQVWVNVPASTYHPQARPLFQYRHYSEQQPLKLNPAEISEVIAEVCSESSSPNVTQLSTPSRLNNHARQPSQDVAFSVLIKLVIDMYMMDSGSAAPLTLYMLEGMLSSQRVASRTRAFDLILNLGVHAHLLEPMLPEDTPITEESKTLQEPYLNSDERDEQSGTQQKRNKELGMNQKTSSAIDNFESWLLVMLFEILLLLVQMEEWEEIVWASALSCLFYFICDRGRILRSRLQGLDIRVIKTLLEISSKHSWAEVVHCKLICILTNMFYQIPDGAAEPVSDTPIFLVEQVDLLGGIDFICLEYSRANSREEKCDLFLILFDYVVHLINEACLAGSVSTYAFEEIQPIASLLTFADAPEAFYITVKHGVGGVGDILRTSVSAALSQSPDYERLNLLLDKITRKLDAIISTFIRLDYEFSYMIQITKDYKSFSSIEGGSEDTDITQRVQISWATLHSLLHSDISACRHHGYIWLVELLLSEISEDTKSSVWTNITRLQQQIGIAGSQDFPSCSEVPLPISILCGLLKSKHNFIKWGFLFVLEKFLMRCKLLLDESETQQTNHEAAVENRLDKATAVIDIMSSALSLVVNETDHINILKMCDMLFSQLCLRLPSTTHKPLGDLKSLRHLFGCSIKSPEGDSEALVSQKKVQNKNIDKNELPQKSESNQSAQQTVIYETTSMAALLLRGCAIAPMELVARVPTSLLYWPLMQLAGAATDDIALGVAVGSTGRGNLPGATSDIRAALLLLLIGKCTADQEAFLEFGGKEFFRGLLDDTDSRVAYYSAAFLLKRMMTEEPENYQRMLQNLISKAQQSNNEKLLENPYLQMRGILLLSNDLGAQ
ncbi:hypothetical protein ACMD2_02291 [Ananas comosus]|uniref:Uncharacterized protein n=1 Tax=Ananas comosus TaxID=4615 RepID=A0A199V5R1_ANACO|nr:hypothetical protein ACMD2_02291 [Ananas comosus]